MQKSSHKKMGMLETQVEKMKSEAGQLGKQLAAESERTKEMEAALTEMRKRSARDAK